MGYARVFYIREEPIREYISTNGRDEAITEEIGRKILSFSVKGTGGFPDTNALTSHPLFDTPSVFFPLDPLFHSTDFRLLIWTGNRLCPLETPSVSMFDSLCQLTDTVGTSHAVLSIPDLEKEDAHVLPNSVAGVARVARYADVASGGRENPLWQSMWASLYWIYEDFSRKFQHIPEVNSPCKEVGDALLNLMFSDLSASENILNHGGALNRCCSLKHPEFAVVVWSGNCLRLLSQLDDNQVQKMRADIEALRR